MKKLLALILAFTMILGLCACSSDSKTYKEAQQLLENGDNKAALEKFESISSYKDAATQAITAALRYANECAEKNNFKDGIDALRKYADDPEVQGAFEYFASEATKKYFDDYDFESILEVIENDFKDIDLSLVYDDTIKSEAYFYFNDKFNFSADGIKKVEAIEILFSRFEINDSNFKSLFSYLNSNKDALVQYGDLYEVVIRYDAVLGDALTNGLNGITDNNAAKMSEASETIGKIINEIKSKYGTEGKLNDFYSIFNDYVESFKIIATSGDANTVNASLDKVDKANLDIQSLYSDIDNNYGLKVNKIIDLIKAL